MSVLDENEGRDNEVTNKETNLSNKLNGTQCFCNPCCFRQVVQIVF